ncbi:MAG: endonuclease/exonuclease/phosphatase family protein [Cellvibrionales bacterium]|nr:endonuclease/exonuclease/phosphatase family protein [Cellvibrionales bacterium]
MAATEFSVCSYNIHKGYRRISHSVLSEIKNALGQLNSDILCLQEVRGKDNHSQQDLCDQVAFISKGIWPYHSYGKNVDRRLTHHGNAILSKLPIEKIDHLDISTLRLSKRGVVVVRLPLGVVMICVHLGLLSHERNKQLIMIKQWINAHLAPETPIIMAGDFNDYSKRLDIEILKAGFCEVSSMNSGKRFKTYPSRLPLLPLDRIYFKHVNCVFSECMQAHPWPELSDHCAIRAVFTLNL